MAESRVVGKTGFYGWTIREGFTKEFVRKPPDSKCGDKCESRPGVD